MRARRHGTKKKQRGQAGSSRADTRRSRHFHSIPASTSIMAVTPASTSAVPRSGWRTTRTINSSGMSAAGSSVRFQSRMASSRVCRNHARKSTSTGLAISEGWKVKKSPKRIQRCVWCEPGMKKTSTSSSVVTHSAG